MSLQTACCAALKPTKRCHCFVGLPDRPCKQCPLAHRLVFQTNRRLSALIWSLRPRHWHKLSLQMTFAGFIRLCSVGAMRMS